MSNLISLSGAALRTMNTPEAQAELDRRMAKRQASGKVTVAALRSWGRTSEAEAVIAQAKATKPAPKAKAKAPAPVITPIKPIPNAEAKCAAFTRTHEVVANPKGAIAHLHNRMCAVEAALVSIAKTQAETQAILKRLTA